MGLAVVKEFHWLTKTVIALLALLFVFILFASLVNTSLFAYIMYYSYILTYLFLIIFVIGILLIVVGRVKAWFEKYMDALLEKLDKITVSDELNDRIAALDYKLEGIEKKMNRVENLLEKISN